MKNTNTFFKKIAIILLITVGSARAQQWGDYTLYSVQNTKTAYLVDTNGTTFHTWTLSTGNTGYSTYMLPGGILLRTIATTGNSFMGGGITGGVQEADYNGNIIWNYVYSSTTYCMHHDVCPMPNGNVLIISYESKSAAQLTQAGGSTSHVIWPDKIIEVQPSGATGGNIVWEWHAWDHLVQNVDPTKDNYYTSISAHPELLNINYLNTTNTRDWMHCNGVDYNPITDQITFTSHYFNEIYVIDHSTTTAEAASHAGGNSGKGGDLLYRWGNPVAYGGTGTANFNVVHDAHWIKQGCLRAGSLVGFNNNGVSMSQSAVDIIDPPINGMTYTVTAGAPATYSKRYTLTGHSNDMGNSQKMPNGNMLFCVATSGLIYETDSLGTTLWSKQLTGTSAKAFRYQSCYLSDTAFAIPTITQNGNVLTSSAANTYQWFYNGSLLPGDTSQSVTMTQSGFYTVQVTSINNCVLKYAPLANYTMVTGINSLNAPADVLIYPNPTSGILTIESSKILKKDFDVMIYDVVGNIIYKDKNKKAIDLSPYKNGIFFLKISTGDAEIITKKISLLK